MVRHDSPDLELKSQFSDGDYSDISCSIDEPIKRFNNSCDTKVQSKKRKNNDVEDYAMIGPPKKKNRAGQRERRKQWESMYGNNANHVIKETKERDKKKREKKKLDTKVAQQDQLHPSWAAKLNAKKSMSQAVSIAIKGSNAATKKIVFDD